MAGYRYPLPSRYRVRYPYKYRKGGTSERAIGLGLGVALIAGVGSGTVSVVRRHAAGRGCTVQPAAAQAIAYARAQVGVVPYAWGGTTTAGFDCSGLTQAAYAAGGVSIKRTSQDQWASEPHVSTPQAGDLVFFAGSDGTPTSPGHVGIVVNPARHLMIDAYETGTDVRYDTYGLPSSAPGLSDPVGFTDPAPATFGSGEGGYIAAVLAALGAPDSSANASSMAAWISRETRGHRSRHGTR